MSGECYPVTSLVADISKPEKEYEAMVSSGESKCAQLRDQLDRIKELYHNQKSSTKLHACPNMKPTKITRQNSHRISTDTTGGPQSTIHNIFAGITKSMPITDFSTAKALDKSIFPQKSIHGVEDVKIHSKSKSTINIIKSKPRIKDKSAKTKEPTRASSSSIVKKGDKTKLFEKKTKINKIPKRGLSLTPKVNTIIKGRTKMTPLRQASYDHQDLVEIYHNTAVKESKSSNSDVPHKPSKIEGKIDRIVKSEIIPPLNIGHKTERVQKEVVTYTRRNYAMPTISSRMKRVAKYYMNSFNIKSIPFCPATSTNPSHNIGINIQQVMNMVKIKQPVAQLSPTLAYNIALAADKWNNNPLSRLLSATSKTISSQCPLIKNALNYQHMQEMAKTVPQAVIEEVDENADNDVFKSPETQSLIITGPSGDVKVMNKKQAVWTSSSEDKKCTCVPQKGLEIQHIINKFNGSMSRSKMNKSSEKVKVCLSTQKMGSIPLQSKEKKLKEVLAKLHDEFEKMTQNYDDLAKKNEQGSNPEINKQLETLDKELTCKEEEIVMVMTLYKEVLALKEQVKALKERSGKDIVNITAQNPNRLNDGTTANLLGSLLTRIQHFQTHYKKR